MKTITTVFCLSLVVSSINASHQPQQGAQDDAGQKDYIDLLAEGNTDVDYLEAVRILKEEFGYDINKSGPQGPPLHRAICVYKNIELAKALIANGAQLYHPEILFDVILSIKQPLKDKTVTAGQIIDLLYLLLDLGANINYELPGSSFFWDGSATIFPFIHMQIIDAEEQNDQDTATARRKILAAIKNYGTQRERTQQAHNALHPLLIPVIIPFILAYMQGQQPSTRAI